MSRHIIENAFAALLTGDANRIRAVFAPDAEWLSPTGNAVATATGAPDHMIGRDAIANFFTRDLPRLFVDALAADIHGMHTDGARTTVEATVTATLPGGGRFVNDYCFVLEVEAGLITEVREYTDTARAHRLISAGTP